MARSSGLHRHIAMLAASMGVWFFGLGLAVHHMREAGLNAATSGIGDPASLSRHLGDVLILTATATQGALFLLFLGAIAFAIRRPAKKGEVPL